MICEVCDHSKRFAFRHAGYNYHRCSHCGLLSTDPIPDGETIEQHYCEKFEHGNYRLAQNYMHFYIQVYQDLVQTLEHYLAESHTDLNQKVILDIGCFTGEFLELLGQKGADVYGLELQEDAVRIANEKLPKRVFKADVMSNDIPRKEFDIVTMIGLIEHVVEPIKLLKRSYEILKPGGILMLQTPDSGCGLERIMGRYWPPCAPVEHIHLFSKKSLQLALRQTGFEDINVVPHWKKLPLDYALSNLQNFGTALYKYIKPVHQRLPAAVLNSQIPFCIGEIILFGRKSP